MVQYRTLTGEGEVPYVNAPEATRVIPPENIPKQAAKAKEEDQGDGTQTAAAADRCASCKESTNVRFPRGRIARRNRGAIHPKPYDATEDNLPQNVAVIRREVLPRVLGSARKS
jgi:hypothetical protein